MKRQISMVALVAALGLAACGGGGSDSPEANEYSDAVLGQMELDSMGLTEAEGQCLSVAVVDALGGPDAFEEAGIKPEDIAGDTDLSDLELDPTDEQITAVAGSFQDCDISVIDIMVRGIGTATTLTDEVESCLRDKLDEQDLADAIAQGLVDSDASQDQLTKVLQPAEACVTS